MKTSINLNNANNYSTAYRTAAQWQSKPFKPKCADMHVYLKITRLLHGQQCGTVWRNIWKISEKTTDFKAHDFMIVVKEIYF